jgi:hypothetical protein
MARSALASPWRDPRFRYRSTTRTPRPWEPAMPSAYWGDRQIWDTRVNNHNMMIDRKGRVWLTAAVRDRNNPAFCN